MFYYRLARELGMTLGRLLNEASSREISGWIAFLEIEEKLEKRKKQKSSDSLLRAKMMEAGQLAAKKHGKRKV